MMFSIALAKSKINGFLLAVLLLTSTSYYIRVPDLSFYIFDIFFLVWFFLNFKQIKTESKLLLLLVIFMLIYFFGLLVFAIANESRFSLKDWAAPFFRFSQFYISWVLLKRIKTGGVRSFNFFNFVYISLINPLVIGIILYIYNKDYVMLFNRYSGVFENPNYLALYIVISSTIVHFVISLNSESLIKKVFLYFIWISVSVYSLFLSGSNSGFLLFLIEYILIILISSKNSLRRLMLLLVLAFLFFLSYNFFNDFVRGFALSIADSDINGVKRASKFLLTLMDGGSLRDLGSAESRENLKEFLFNRWTQDIFYFLFGFGLGQSKYISMDMFGEALSAHNFYWTILYELGVIGSILFAMILLEIFRNVSWGYLKILCATGFILSCNATPYLYLPFFWFPLIFCLLSDDEPSSLPPYHQPGRRRRRGGALPAMYPGQR